MPNCISPLIIDHGFDRAEIWLDRSEYPGQLAVLQAHCRAVKSIVGDVPYNPRWKSHLEIFQPTLDCLKQLKADLGTTVATHIAYVEVAVDLIPSTSETTNKLEGAFLRAAVPKHHRREAKRVEGTTWYFESRLNAKGQRRAHVLVVYADKPSKLKNRRHWNKTRPCLHIEMRISGADALQRAGIHAIDDLIQFRHSGFWKNHIDLYRLPNKTQLGQLIGAMQGKRHKVSDTALVKRANQWLQQNTDEEADQFVLHNAVRGKRRRAFDAHRVSFKQWLPNALK